jgi:hypothetical protein
MSFSFGASYPDHCRIGSCPAEGLRRRRVRFSLRYSLERVGQPAFEGLALRSWGLYDDVYRGPRAFLVICILFVAIVGGKVSSSLALPLLRLLVDDEVSYGQLVLSHGRVRIMEEIGNNPHLLHHSMRQHRTVHRVYLHLTPHHARCLAYSSSSYSTNAVIKCFSLRSGEVEYP